MKKIYVVQASWHAYEEFHTKTLVAFTSKEEAQKYIDTIPEKYEAAERRLNELLEVRGYKPGQIIALYSVDKELMDAINECDVFDVPYDEVYFQISECELKD